MEGARLRRLVVRPACVRDEALPGGCGPTGARAKMDELGRGLGLGQGRIQWSSNLPRDVCSEVDDGIVSSCIKVIASRYKAHETAKKGK